MDDLSRWNGRVKSESCVYVGFRAQEGHDEALMRMEKKRNCSPLLSPHDWYIFITYMNFREFRDVMNKKNSEGSTGVKLSEGRKEMYLKEGSTGIKL